MSEATSKIAKYIEWKQSSEKNKAKDNSGKIVKDLNITTEDGCFNIIRREYVRLSLKKQREILPKILDEMESLAE